MASFFTQVGIQAVIQGVPTVSAGMSVLRREAALAQRGFISMGKGGDSASRSIANMGRSIASAGSSMRNFGAGIRTVGNELNSIGFRLSAFITAPILGAAGAIADAGADFESVMVRTITLAGASEQQMASWRQEILNTATAIGALPLDTAEGLYNVVSAGLRDTAVAMDIVTRSAKASEVGLGDVNDITRVVTAAMQTFGQENLSAEQAINQLIAGVREGAIETDSLAGTLGRVIAVSAELGVSFAESLGFIATFSRTGVGAEVAITGLRAALTAILKPTDQSISKLAEFDITMAEVRDAIADPNIGLAKTLIALTSVLGADDEAIGKVIGTARGLAGVLSVTGNLSSDYLTIVDEIVNSNGELERTFGRVSQTSAFLFDQTKVAVTTLAITLSDVLQPAFVNLATGITALVENVRQIAIANPAFVEFAAKVALAAAAIGPLVLLVGIFVNSLGVIVGAAGTVVTILGLIAASFGGLAAPIGIAIGVLGTFAALIVLRIKNIREKMNNSFAGLANNARTWGSRLVVEFARGIIQAITFVVRALAQLAAVVTRLLRPKSPPPILPDIDKWGKETAQLYFDSWGLADFSVFSDIADTITGILRSISESSPQGDVNVVRKILGTRTEIAKAIQEFASLGAISERTISKITASLGGSATAAGRYIRLLFELQNATKAVGEAQKNLQTIQDKFAASLDPIAGRLDEIARIRQDFEDQKRIKILQEIVADPSADPDAVRFAKLELEEISLRKRQETIEDARDKAVKQAELELKKAQEKQAELELQLATQKALLDLQVEQNNLMKELVDAIKALEESLKDAGSAAGDIGAGLEDFGDIGGGLDDALANVEEIATGMTEAERRLEDFLRLGEDGDGTFLDGIDTSIGDLDQALLDLKTDLAGIFDGLADELAPDLSALEKALDSFDTNTAGMFDGIIVFFEDLPQKLSILGKRLDETGKKIKNFFEGGGVVGKASGPFAEGGFFDTVLDAVSSLIGLDQLVRKSSLIAFFEAFKNTVAPAFKEAGTAIEVAWGQIEPVLKRIEPLAAPALKLAGALLTLVAGGLLLVTIAAPLALLTGILTGFANFVEVVAETVGKLAARFDSLVKGFEKVITALVTIFTSPDVAEINKALGDLFGGIIQIIVNGTSLMLTFFLAPFKIILKTVEGFVVGVIGFFQELYNVLVGESIVPDLINAIFAEFLRLVLLPFTIILPFINTILGFMTGLLDSLVGEDGIVGRLITGVVALFDNLVLLVTGEGGVMSRFRSGLESAFDLGSILSGAINSWIPSIVGKFYDAGVAFVEGLIQGMLAGGSGLQSTGNSVGQQVSGGVSGELDINSPSGVGIDQGINYVDGIIGGVVSRFSALNNVAKNIAFVMGAANGLPGAASSASSGPGNTSVSFGNVNLNNRMDEVALSRLVTKSIAKSVG